MRWKKLIEIILFLLFWFQNTRLIAPLFLILGNNFYKEELNLFKKKNKMNLQKLAGMSLGLSDNVKWSI